MLSPVLKKLVPEVTGVPAKRGDVGIELETEGENLPIDVTNWITKTEGSLRGKKGRVVSAEEEAPDTPREYVSRGPFTIDTVHARVQTLVDAFKTANSVVNLTDRASTHIHLNMTRETVSTLLATFVIYAAIEPVLLRLCGERRNGNLFCLPSFETWDLPSYAALLSDALSRPEPRHRWPHRGKYGAINPDPLTSLGSIEFRCFPNTFDPRIIQTYANWLVNIRTLASAMEPPFDRELAQFWRNPSHLLDAVFGTTPLRIACQPHNPHNLVLFGLEQSNEIREGFETLFDYNDKAVKSDTAGELPLEPLPWPTETTAMEVDW